LKNLLAFGLAVLFMAFLAMAPPALAFAGTLDIQISNGLTNGIGGIPLPGIGTEAGGRLGAGSTSLTNIN